MFRIYVLIGVVSLFGAGIFGAKYYYDTSQKKIQILTENAVKLKITSAAKDTIILENEKFRVEQQAKIKTLNSSIADAESNVAYLRKIIGEHNLTFLALKKPKLIENRINTATDRLFKSLENITK